jgi:hypothetical protein
MVATLDHGLRGLRDRAILLIGFAGGLRRSEITGLDCGPEQTEEGAGWIEFLDQGLLIRVRGKTGWREVEVGRGSSDSTCPVVALQTWLKLGRIAHGPVFRRITGGGKEAGRDRLTDKHVARLVKRTALAAGVRGDLPEAERRGKFSGQLPARRPRLLRTGRRALRPKAARPRQRRDDLRDLPDLARLEGAGLLGKAPLPEELRDALGITDDDDRAESEADDDGEGDQEYAGVGLFEE